MRCPSQYQNVNTEGKPLGAPKRCTGPEGHEQMHYNFTPGHKIKWPDSAAIKSLPIVTPIPEELCSLVGYWSDAAALKHTGQCVFLKLHEGSHSWV